MRDDPAPHENAISDGDYVFPIGGDCTAYAGLRTIAEALGSRLVIEDGADWQSWSAAAADATPGCVLLDTAGVDRADLIRRLAAIGTRHATIVLTDRDEVADAVAAMRAGAVDVLRKPVALAELTGAVSAALVGMRRQTERLARSDGAKSAVARLSPREQAVMAGLVAGLSTEAIARRLDISPRTLASDRRRVMRTTGSASVIELMRCALAAGMLVET